MAAKPEPAFGAPGKSTFRRHTTASSLSVWQALKEAAVPVLVYDAAVIFSFLAFCGAVLVSDGIDAGGIVILIVLGLTTAAGVLAGQVLAFLRIRTWILILFGAFCWMLSLAVGLAMGALGEFAAIIALSIWLFPIALTGGLWSLETHRALWSTWLPLLYSTAAVIIWSENMGNADRWFAGQKWALWDIVTIVILAVTIVLTLFYLLARETHRLALWRRGPTAPLAPTLQEKGAARPRLTILSTVLLLGMAVVLTIATAVLSPYFWRTGDPGDHEADNGGETQEQTEPPPEPGENEFLKKLGEALEKMAQQAVEAGEKAGGTVCTALSLLILAALGLIVGDRPLKRLFLVRHLRDPFWSVPATGRIENGWRLVEIAMADAGVYPRPGEDAAGLARRAAPVLAKLSPVEVHGLEDAAEIADRVRFGLGVGDKDVEVMQRFAAWAIDTVWERLGDGEQVRCMYREL